MFPVDFHCPFCRWSPYLSRMDMSLTEIIMGIIIALLIGLFAAYLFYAQRKFQEFEDQLEKRGGDKKNPLSLAAYERLTLFTERNKLSNLAGRFNLSGQSSIALQQSLLATIREEFEHNITQQLYVKKEIWDALTKMKDQNCYIINQIAANMPPDTAAIDLSRQLVQFEANNPNSTLNQKILEALQYEVQQIL